MDCILVEYLSSLNTVITETFKSTQRIKLTCLEVCGSYLIFGASSGGIYIFKRTPCEFVKLIPNKEGSIVQITISQNERDLAAASSEGIIIIIENFMESSVTPLLYNEHEGNTVTQIKWHGKYLYCGDNAGKVSVFILATLLTKAIFHIPSAVLMHLDSAIVQINVYLNYLLISTKTRTFLCDTEKEQYKQIGKKLRDGNFGACFSYTKNRENIVTNNKAIGLFKTISEDEQLSDISNDNETKIYCARPGVRLWQADFSATVLITHQFREALYQKPADILSIDDKPDAQLNISKCDDIEEVPKNFNFGKIYSFNERFILTFNNSGLYFFDPTTSKLKLWTSILNIEDIKMFDNLIYIWKKDQKISIISFESLESLLINTLFNKQYGFCAELCVYYESEVHDIIEESKENTSLYLLSILKTKLKEVNADNLLPKIQLIFDRLDFHKKQADENIKKNIAVIENGYLPISLLNFKDSTSEQSEDEENKSSNYTEENYDNNTKLFALYKLYIINKSYKNAELTESNKVFQSLNLNEIFSLFLEFQEFIKEKYDEDADWWCKEQIVKQAAEKRSDILDLEPNTLQYLSDAYLILNKVENLICKCNFPLPLAHTKKPFYYDLGCDLLDKLDKQHDYLYNIPYLYRHTLNKVSETTHSFLTLMIQFSDKSLLKEMLTKFTYDTFDDVIKLFIKLKNAQCLNCSENIDINEVMSWTDLGFLMVESIGSKNACRLLKRYSDHIPSNELGCKFYQSCILAAVYKEQELAVNYMENIVNCDVLPKLEDSLEKFILKKYVDKQSQTVKSKTSTNCSLCGLPLNGLVLYEEEKAECGHQFHSLCYSRMKGICNICISN